MVLPIAVLAVPAMLIGFANIDGGVAHLLEGALPETTAEELHEFEFSWGIALASTAVAGGGIAVAWLFYGARVLSSEAVGNALRPIRTLLERKYYLDDLYERVIVETILYRGIVTSAALFDTYVVDGVANGAAAALRAGSFGLRRLQTGQVQVYGAVAFAGLLIAVGLAFLLSPV
jgi:NADH-quinone oxidoreductase subunit L